MDDALKEHIKKWLHVLPFIKNVSPASAQAQFVPSCDEMTLYDYFISSRESNTLFIQTGLANCRFHVLEYNILTKQSVAKYEGMLHEGKVYTFDLPKPQH